MLCVSRRLGWTPNYFRNVRRPGRFVPNLSLKRTPHTLWTSKPEEYINNNNKNPTWVPSLYYVNILLERHNFSEANSSQRKERERLVLRAQELHLEWDRAQAILPEQVRNNRLVYICFQARQNVLAPLEKFLRASSRAHVGAPRYQALKLCPILDDSEIMEDGTPRVSAFSRESFTPCISDDWGITFFSLEDLVVFLDLYHHTESENGQLLCQLFDEVNRFLFGNVLTVMRDSSAQPTLVRLPFPQLLFTMSELGLAGERMLQAIVRHPEKENQTCHHGNPKAKGLLYTSLPLYTARDLLLLMVALYRFGLQQTYAFEQTLKALRALMRNSGSSAARFQRQVGKSKTDFFNSSQTENHEKTVGALEGLGIEKFDPWLRMFPALGDLQCPLKLLVEAVTALSMSVFRSRDILDFVGNLLAATAHAELRAVMLASSINCEEKKSTLLAISHQLHRAVHLFEEMNEHQPILAELLGWSCSISKVGVLIEGGEDTAIPSERRAYYDHVTADLIKVNRV